MKNLFDPNAAQEVKERLEQLRPDSARLWGSMNAAQMAAHCSAGIQMAFGEVKPPRAFIGRVIGPLIKKKVVGDDAPLRRNSPTARELVMRDDRDLEKERTHLRGLIDRFVAGGPSGCTSHPHAFFGRMSPEEWSILMYKHLDHHLRQFGV